MREQAKRLIGPRATVQLRSLMRGYERPRWGNPRRTVPFSAEYWRLSPDGWREPLSVAWPGASLEVAGRGNCLAAMAAQLGLSLEELTRVELDAHDPRYPVLTTIVCHRPP